MMKGSCHEKQDEDLFKTARLITNGLYINISLHDYLRGLANAHHSASDWALVPRVEIDKTFDQEGLPSRVGNQVSCEFNLLYRFHSVISQKDEEWLNDFFSNVIFKDIDKPLDQITAVGLWQALIRFEMMVPKDPSVRESMANSMMPTLSTSCMKAWKNLPVGPGCRLGFHF
jgi:hypothetical protein